MEDVFNKLDEGILVINKKGEIKFCNSRLLIKLQYKKYELENRCVSIILGEEAICKDIDKYLEKEVALSMSAKDNEKIAFKSEIIIGEFNGEEVFIIILKDIKNEQYINGYLEELLNNAPFCIWLKDINGKYVYSNKAIGDIYNLAKEDVIGKVDKELWNEEDAKELFKQDKYVEREKVSKVFETMRMKKNGQREWYEAYKTPIFDKDGKVKYTAGIAKDITLRKELEKKLDNSHKKLTTLDNIIDNKYECNTNYRILNNLQHYIIKNIGSDGLNIWIYNKKNNTVVSEFSTGIANELVKSGEIIKLRLEDIYESSHDGINPLDKLRNTLYIDMIREIGVKYVGYYNITFNNEFLGIVSILYKQLKYPLYNQDDYIKTICNQIGMIIKNENLSNEVSQEFKERRDIEEELEEFLNTATEVMIVIDEPGRFIKVNNGCEKVLGWKKEELLNMNWQDIVHSEDLNNSIKFLELIKSGNKNSQRIVNRFRTSNGNFKWLDWGIKYIRCKNKIVCTARDITEERKMEEERKKYEEKLIHERIKNEFFTNMSHEFRTPLNIIISTIQLINKKIVENNTYNISEIDFSRYMNSIRQNSYRLLRLVNNLIDITRIDTGYYNINLENHNIVNIVEDITDSVIRYIGNKGLSLIFDTEVEEKIIACDPDKIEKIMLNLLSNSIKYTGENGKIYVDLKLELHNVVISVRDNGIGIPSEKLESIFERFIQVDSTLARVCEGSGIGLSLVKSLVEMHGGSIKVNSISGEFTEFIFTIPIRNIKNESELKIRDNTITSRVEKCNVEFSDIYKEFDNNI